MDSLLNDFNRELSGYLSGLTFSDEDFYTLERRLDLINQLKAKYGGSLKQIAVSLEEKQERLDSLTHMQERKEELENKLRTAENNLFQASESLSRLRKKHGKELSEKIKENLKQLNFEQVAFSIQFEKSKNCTENGWDEVQYLISTNPGEPMLPLSRVVSGGELSRIMLAIKTLMADKDDVETLIFDEIDTGISGRTAQLVAEKMARIGCSRQVICITHLPQIAAMADNHFEISKHVENQETVTRIRRLDSDESMVELARMLGGARITDTVMHNAREMKELAQVQKCTSVK